MSETGLIAPIRIDGLNALRKQLKEIEAGAEKELRPALNRAAEIVVNVARPRVPVLRGAARRSLRVSSTGNKVRVTAGGKAAPYFPWLDYGGTTGPGHSGKSGNAGFSRGSISRPFLKHGRYIYPAYYQERPNIIRAIEKQVRDLIESKGLHVDG